MDSPWVREILIFQDIVIVPMILFISLLVEVGGNLNVDYIVFLLELAGIIFFITSGKNGLFYESYIILPVYKAVNSLYLVLLQYVYQLQVNYNRYFLCVIFLVVIF